MNGIVNYFWLVVLFGQMLEVIFQHHGAYMGYGLMAHTTIDGHFTWFYHSNHKGKTWQKTNLVGGLNPSEKYESQLGWLFPISGKIKNVPNHQPEILRMSLEVIWDILPSPCPLALAPSQAVDQRVVWVVGWVSFCRLHPNMSKWPQKNVVNECNWWWATYKHINIRLQYLTFRRHRDVGYYR